MWNKQRTLVMLNYRYVHEQIQCRCSKPDLPVVKHICSNVHMCTNANRTTEWKNFAHISACSK